MTIKFEIYFNDLKSETKEQLLKEFMTTAEDENWDMNIVPIAVIEREREEKPKIINSRS